MSNLPSHLELEDGSQIAYHKTDPKDNSKPGIIFIHGFKSDMDGSKAIAIEEFCKEQGLGYIRFDCTGHGQSSRDFLEGTISEWASNTVAVLDKLSKGPQILVGSSMGGWLMLLAALKNPERIHALVGIAAAPDFVEELLWKNLSEELKETLTSTGSCEIPSDYEDSADEDAQPYVVTQLLVDDARNNLLLGSSIPIHRPVRLIYGMKDEDVPYSLQEQLRDQLETNDVAIILSPNGNHRMSEEKDIALITETISALL